MLTAVPMINAATQAGNPNGGGVFLAKINPARNQIRKNDTATAIRNGSQRATTRLSNGLLIPPTTATQYFHPEDFCRIVTSVVIVHSFRICGSSASLSPSPRKFKEKSMSAIVTPGKISCHG